MQMITINRRGTFREGCILLAGASAVMLAAATVHAQGYDRVRLIAGETKTGEIQSMTSQAVRLGPGSRASTVPVNQIQSIQYDQEPIELTRARSEVRHGAYREALETLSKLDDSSIRRTEIRQDVGFYRALAQAKIALANGEALIDAGRALNDFLGANPSNYHFYEGVEVLGDLFAAVGRYDQAATRYAMLAETDWPEFKIRARVLEGRALAAQEKHEEAIKRFEEALSLESDAPTVAAEQLSALLGKAQSQSEVGQTKEAVAAVEQVIAGAEAEALELQARAHNVLGQCHLTAGNAKEALFAFLYVDVMCSSLPDAHAEALYHLIPLYGTVGRDEDSRQARQRLIQRYPGSTWTKKLAEAG